MDRKKILILFLAVLMVLPAGSTAFAARDAGIVILADLSHDQPATGLDVIMKMMPEAKWYLLVGSEDQIETLPHTLQVMADNIFVGTFATISEQLGEVDVLLIGQPVKEFTPDEIEAITTWFYSNPSVRKVIWLAGDSDYPAQGGNLEIAHHTINAIAEALGTSLREDYVSVEDYTSNTGKPYRVVGLVQPDPGAEVVGFAVEKVLFHGPGVIAYVDQDGTWKSLTDSKPDNVYRIVWTTEDSAIVEHQPSQPGAPGDVGQAYTAGDTGKFVLLAAEVMTVNVEGTEAERVVIMSGESPYGDYQPGVTWSYYGIHLDGPRFIRNLLLWSTGYMGELKGVEELLNQIKALEDQLAQKDQQISGLENQLTQLQNQLSDLQNQLENIQTTASEALTTAQQAGGKGVAYSGVALAIIALLAAAFVATKK